ncbi:MAG TPA: SRPBCC family protein [Thermoplasmata archaeon]|nr:SRPBCC family protein [Thermoplasmata archaeon]
MARIEKSVTIAADPQTVWSLASALDREPEIWKGTKAVRTLASSGNVVEREVTLAFRDRTERERVTLEPPVRVVHELLEGPMRGTKTVSVTPRGDGTTELSAVYEVTLTGLLKLGTRPFTTHAAEGVEHALQRIKAIAEGREPPK